MKSSYRGRRRPTPRRRRLALAIWSACGVVAAVFLSHVAAEEAGTAWAPATAGLSIGLLAALGLAAQLLYQRAADDRNHRPSLAALAALGPPFVLGWLLLPNGTPWSGAVLSGLFVGTCLLALLISEVRPCAKRQASQDLSPEPLDAVVAPSAAGIGVPAEFDDPKLDQWMTRTTDDDGTESIAGAARVSLAAGQREALLHLAFCPPLSRVPEISCETLDGADVRLKVAAALPYGARIQVKRATAAVADAARIGFFAVAAAAQRRAA